MLDELLENILNQSRETEMRLSNLADALCGREPEPEGLSSEKEPDPSSILETYIRRAHRIMQRINSIDREIHRIEREFEG